VALLALGSDRRFDGAGQSDGVRIEAAMIVTAAFDDERAHRGSLQCTDSLACFLEFRITQALREILMNVS
jgi:hypothetical protein